MRVKIFWIIFIAVIVAGASGTSFAYRPLGTEDAGVAGKGVVQTELSWDHLKWNGDKKNVFLFAPIYGLTERLELSAEIPYLVHRFESAPSGEGVGDINLVGKYLLIQEGERNPAFTLKGAVKMDNGDFEKGFGSGDRDYSIFAISSKTMGNIAVHGHVGYTRTGKDKVSNLRDVYLYGLALDYGITEAFHVVGEMNGNRHPDRTENQDPRTALLGAAYTLSQNLTADFGVRKGLTTTAPEWSATIGISITF